MSEIKIDQIIRSRRRTVGLQITPDANLIVRVPQKMPLEAIHEVARKKLPWILRKQRFARKHYLPVVPWVFTAGGKFLYLGEGY
ncbi:MAG: YgjP-like metallopeptidase domain-containing protein [Candidatus Omnitrophota bacterium]